MTPLPRTLLATILLTAIAAFSVALVATTGIVARIESSLHDQRIRSRLATRPPGQDIVLAWIDQDSIDAMRREGVSFPWPRSFHGEALEWLRAAGARVVGFDLLFSEPGLAEDDRMFADGIQDKPAVVFAHKLIDWRDGGFDDEETARIQQRSRPVPEQLSGRLRHHRGAVLPIQEFDQKASAVGFVNVQADHDEVFRRHDLLRGIGTGAHPSFALALAEAATGQKLTIHQGRASLGQIHTPIDREGRLVLNFRGPEYTFSKVKLFNILQSAELSRTGQQPIYPPSLFKDRIVIIGIHAEGAEDITASPTSSRFLGPELHATALDNLLRGDAILAFDHWSMETLLVLLAALAAVVSVRLPARLSVALSLGLSVPVLVVFVSFLLFATHTWLLPTAAPMLAGLTGTGAGLVQRLGIEGRQRRTLRRAFGSYMAPEVVAEVLKDPANLKLGGQTRTVTVMFADLSGFTRMAETMAPAEVVAFLNDYFTRMGDRVMAEAGVIDKFIGDAIMALFGAPAIRPDHGAAALRASMAMLAELERINHQLVATGHAPLRMRIGLHTGPAVVGNMGSARRFDYTAIGDTVNLASRLEGAGKNLGVPVVVSEITAATADREFVLRELVRVRVPGRAAPVRVFEPLGPAADLSPVDRQFLAAYNAALDALHRGAPDAITHFRAVVQLRPDDTVSRLHLDHLERNGVDQVFTIDTK